MPDDLYGLTPDDLDVLKALAQRVRNSRVNTDQRTQEDSLVHQEGMSPEIYIAKAPADGIPALIPGDGSTTEDEPGSAECVIYRAEFDTDGVRRLRETRVPDRTVINLSSVPVQPDARVLITRDKFGTWVVTSTESVLQYQLVCENGWLNLYTVDSDGVWEFQSGFSVPCYNPRLDEGVVVGTGTGTGTNVPVGPSPGGGYSTYPFILEYVSKICAEYGDCLEVTTDTFLGYSNWKVFVDATDGNVIIYLPSWRAAEDFYIVRKDSTSNFVFIVVLEELTEVVNNHSFVVLQGEFTSAHVMAGCTEGEWIALLEEVDDTGTGTGSDTGTGSGPVFIEGGITGTDITGLLAGDGSVVHTVALPLSVGNGGTGASTAALARTSLGVPAGSGTSTGTNTGDQTSVTGNAGTATALQTARNINGVAFDGTANITVPAAGSTLTDTVTVAKGGTGAVTLTSNGVVIGNGTGAVTVTAEGATGKVLTGVTGADPTFQDPITATEGSAALGADYVIATASGTYGGTGLIAAIPGAGKWDVVFECSAQNTPGASGTFWQIVGKLRDTTNAVDIANTECNVGYTAVAAVISWFGNKTWSRSITTTGAANIELYVKKVTDGAFTDARITASASGPAVCRYKKTGM